MNYKNYDELDYALQTSGVGLRIIPSRQQEIDVTVDLYSIGLMKIVHSSGEPVSARRTGKEVASDGGEFFGITYQRDGVSVWESNGAQTLIESGNIGIWRGNQSRTLRLPQTYNKICLFAPIALFEGILPDAPSYGGLELERDLNITRLLGSCITTLVDDVLHHSSQPASEDANYVIDMVANALIRHKESQTREPGTSLYNRILAFIEERLSDQDLTPAMIANHHHISLRYLHLIFSDRGTTVGKVIRQRRLAACRSDLARSTTDRGISEIAYNWGFRDTTHFSHAFKLMYGVSPREYRATVRSSIEFKRARSRIINIA